MSFGIIDNSADVKAAFEAAMRYTLAKCGVSAEEYAKRLCRVVTGDLRNSITHEVVDDEHAV